MKTHANTTLTQFPLTGFCDRSDVQNLLETVGIKDS